MSDLNLPRRIGTGLPRAARAGLPLCSNLEEQGGCVLASCYRERLSMGAVDEESTAAVSWLRHQVYSGERAAILAQSERL